MVVLAVAVSGACRADGFRTAETVEYRIVDVEPPQLDLTALGLTHCTNVLAVSEQRALAACRLKSADKKNDVSLRRKIL